MLKYHGGTTIRRRLYCLLLIQITILLLWFGCEAAVEKQGNIEKNRLQAEQLAAQIYATVDSAVNMMANVTMMPVQRDVKGIASDIYKYLSNYPHEETFSVEYFSAFESTAVNALNLNPSLSCISIINTAGKGLILNGQSLWSRSNAFTQDMTQPWTLEVMSAKGRATDPFVLEQNPFQECNGKKLMIRARAIVIAEQYQIGGISVAGVALEPFEQMFLGERQYSEQRMILFNSAGRLLSGEGGEALLSGLQRTDGAVSENRIVDGEKYVVSTCFPEGASFGVSILTPRSVMLRSINRYAKVLYLFIALLTGATLAAYALIFKRIRDPINALVQTVDAYSKGDFAVRASKTGTYEFDLLADALNHMSDEITRLIRDAYQSRMEAQAYEIRVLRSQVNPHFLYNALESARMRAYVNGDKDVEWIIMHLACVLRYGLVASSEPVTLEMELRHARDYLDVANACSRNPITLNVTLEDGCEACLLPRVTLQPLIENCVRHGFEKGERAGIITVYGYIDGDICVVTIADNGCGTDAARLQQLRESLLHGCESETDRSGIGLHNVHRRLQLMMGIESGLSVNSVEGMGFSVEMRLTMRG